MSSNEDRQPVDQPVELATREMILSTCNAARRIGHVDIPSFGRVAIRSLVDAEKRDIEQNADSEFGLVFADYAIACCVDANGEQLFSGMHRDRLSKMDYALSRPIMDAIMRHCAVGPYVQSDEQLKKS